MAKAPSLLLINECLSCTVRVTFVCSACLPTCLSLLSYIFCYVRCLRENNSQYNFYQTNSALSSVIWMWLSVGWGPVRRVSLLFFFLTRSLSGYCACNSSYLLRLLFIRLARGVSRGQFVTCLTFRFWKPSLVVLLWCVLFAFQSFVSLALIDSDETSGSGLRRAELQYCNGCA